MNYKNTIFPHFTQEKQKNLIPREEKENITPQQRKKSSHSNDQKQREAPQKGVPLVEYG